MTIAITDLAAIEAEMQRRLMARTPAPPRALGLPGFLPHLQRVVCADGFNVSVQAGHTHYCSPRENEGPWHQVELGFPSAPMPELDRWIDAPEEEATTATQTVWGYVPLRKVAEVLAAHGGLMPERAA